MLINNDVLALDKQINVKNSQQISKQKFGMSSDKKNESTVESSADDDTCTSSLNKKMKLESSYANHSSSLFIDNDDNVVDNQMQESTMTTDNGNLQTVPE